MLTWCGSFALLVMMWRPPWEQPGLLGFVLGTAPLLPAMTPNVVLDMEMAIESSARQFTEDEVEETRQPAFLEAMPTTTNRTKRCRFTPVIDDSQTRRRLVELWGDII